MNISIKVSVREITNSLVHYTAAIYILTVLVFLFIEPREGRSATVPIIQQTNVTIRIMSANIVGSSQEYEPPAIRIFQALKPDIVAIQEFNYGNNSDADIRLFINTTFGTNFFFFRETNSDYSIPNGIISRYPIVFAGSIDDPEIPDRGFAYAVIDAPGEKDLVVISVHLKSGSSYANRRASEATYLKQIIATNFNQYEYLILAGDFNIYSTNETAYKTIVSILSDSHIPTDTQGDPDTNLNRNERYDFIFPSFNLDALTTPVKIGARYFTNGLVFDSRNFGILSDVSPVQQTDSAQAQHLAVIKDFCLSFTTTNYLPMNNPRIRIDKNGSLLWQGATNLTYSVYSSSNLVNWRKIGNATSSQNWYMYFYKPMTEEILFFKVSYP